MHVRVRCGNNGFTRLKRKVSLDENVYENRPVRGGQPTKSPQVCNTGGSRQKVGLTASFVPSCVAAKYLWSRDRSRPGLILMFSFRKFFSAFKVARKMFFFYKSDFENKQNSYSYSILNNKHIRISFMWCFLHCFAIFRGF